jgi:hypothetical protein
MFIDYIPMTRGWADIATKGTPVGAQTPSLLSNNAGDPSTRTRVAGTRNTPLTHGPPETSGNGQPAIVYGGSIVTAGCLIV